MNCQYLVNCSMWFNLKSTSVTSVTEVLLFLQVLFGEEEGNYGNQESDAERDGGAVDPDVSQHATVLPDQKEDLQIQVQMHAWEFNGGCH